MNRVKITGYFYLDPSEVDEEDKTGVTSEGYDSICDSPIEALEDLKIEPA